MTIWQVVMGAIPLLAVLGQTPAVIEGPRTMGATDTIRQAGVTDTLKKPATDSLTRLSADSVTRPAYLSVVSRPAEPFMIQRVAFVSDFLHRLNYQQTPTQQAFDSLSRLTYPRERYLRMLFNEDDPRLNARSGRHSPAYQTLVDEFVSTIANDTAAVLLPKDTEQLFGEVEYTVLYKNTPQKVTFFLKRNRTDSYSDWKIIDAEAPFLKASRTDTMRLDTSRRNDRSLFISSETHETRFLNLFNFLRNRENLLAFTLSAYPVSKTLIRLSKAVQDGSLTLQQTQKVHLYLDIRRGWLLKLEDFHREKENAGWLITDLYSVEYRTPLPAALSRYMKWSASSKKPD
ncbi:hypothetical protein ACS5NO_03525 [Larkinella sp. GY13]|uniref:hypothetical protein n=1 Tax=Larkinella sp. GY13 TaxID=3453720 RepID=UPI003EEB5955